MAKVVVVKFKGGCRPYYFQPTKDELKKGQGVIVETAKGVEYAVVVEPIREVPDEAIVSPLKPVLRPATEQDEATVKKNEERRGDAIRICKEKVLAHGLEMKIIDCEFTFDGSKVVFYFSSEGRVDFRELVKDLASVFHIRIELRQIGIRDETKMLGGIAPCGRECCCAGCMPEFKKVSIKMAKNQGLSLNPGKISGLCGRLMCCLSYENDYYAEAYKKAPKVGGTVGTPEGTGTVVSVNMLKMECKVKIEKDGALIYRDFPISEIAFKKSHEKDDDEDIPETESVPAPKKEERREPKERKDGEKSRRDYKDGEKPRRDFKDGEKPHRDFKGEGKPRHDFKGGKKPWNGGKDKKPRPDDKK